MGRKSNNEGRTDREVTAGLKSVLQAELTLKQANLSVFPTTQRQRQRQSKSCMKKNTSCIFRNTLTPLPQNLLTGSDCGLKPT